MFADRDDITLGNPFGPFGKGREAVLKTLNNASTKYHDDGLKIPCESLLIEVS